MSDGQWQIGPVQSGDIEQMIELDRDLGAGKRSDFFHKRLQAMDQTPEAYIGLVAREDSVFCGFLLAHILRGEFGAAQPVAVLDALGVQAEKQGLGIGDQLVQTLKAAARAQGCGELRTQASWAQQDLLTYFASAGFSLAPRTVLERAAF